MRKRDKPEPRRNGVSVNARAPSPLSSPLSTTYHHTRTTVHKRKGTRKGTGDAPPPASPVDDCNPSTAEGEGGDNSDRNNIEEEAKGTGKGMDSHLSSLLGFKVDWDSWKEEKERRDNEMAGVGITDPKDVDYFEQFLTSHARPKDTTTYTHIRYGNPGPRGANVRPLASSHTVGAGGAAGGRSTELCITPRVTGDGSHAAQGTFTQRGLVSQVSHTPRTPRQSLRVQPSFEISDIKRTRSKGRNRKPCAARAVSSYGEGSERTGAGQGPRVARGSRQPRSTHSLGGGGDESLGWNEGDIDPPRVAEQSGLRRGPVIDGPRVRQRLKTRPAVTSQPKHKHHTLSPSAVPVARKYASEPVLPTPVTPHKRSVHYADSAVTMTTTTTTTGGTRDTNQDNVPRGEKGSGGPGGRKVRPLPIPRRVNAPVWSPRNAGAGTPRGSRQRKPGP